MNNYDRMMESARRRFLEYDPEILAGRTGVWDDGAYLRTTFLAQQVQICKTRGDILLGGRKADFVEALSIYDWLCDARRGAVSAMEFCPVASLPGIYVRGSNLHISGDALAQRIHQQPQAFGDACRRLDACPAELGDLGFRLNIFPDLPMCLKFYFGDEEFPPQLTMLWDKNILQFVRYETIYYIAACLQSRLRQLMAP